jgi:hypothetical protein
METKEYIGTYGIRKIGKDELGIHMPDNVSGDYQIRVDEAGVFTLTPVGVRR